VQNGEKQVDLAKNGSGSFGVESVADLLWNTQLTIN